MFGKKNKIKRPRPVVLIILDGWGVNQPYAGNAVYLADTSNIDQMTATYPSMTIRASGEAVGLPWGEMGNSEVGHLNLGLGRILYQVLPRINRDINNENFYNNETLKKAFAHAKKHNSKMHFLGVASNGCVHASIDHLYALLIFAKKENIKEIYIHAILDGRDVSYNSGINYIKGIQKTINEHKLGKIVTLTGRFYTMDRNNNWDRTEKAYLALTKGLGNKAEDPVKAIELSYKKRIYDEEFSPSVIYEADKPAGLINNNDSLVFFNYRPDRARQITRAFVNEDFNQFNRGGKIKNLFFAAFTEYEKDMPIEVVFSPENHNNTLGQVLEKSKLKQLRIAETEKYAHVTYFFNGGSEVKSAGEEHVLIPSPAISSYDLKPEMSAPEITKKILEVIKNDEYDVIIANFANADMVGHTGKIEATVKAISYLDKCVDKIVKTVLKKDGIVIITADHGNAEVMFDMQTGQIDKEHTTNPVPFIMAGNELAGRNFGWQNVVGSDLNTIRPQGILADVAPTLLNVLNIKKPEDMSGFSLY